MNPYTHYLTYGAVAFDSRYNIRPTDYRMSLSLPCSVSSCPPALDYTNYRIGRGETGVLTYEPYKSALLPLWRFRTPAMARASSTDLWNAFLTYEEANDFVGMDMSRKYLQMGMTRAKRYANHKGGKKYKSRSKGDSCRKRQMVEQCLDEDWPGRRDKEEASLIFREAWERAKDYEPYQVSKKAFTKRQKEWDTRKMVGQGKAEQKRRKSRDANVVEVELTLEPS